MVPLTWKKKILMDLELYLVYTLVMHILFVATHVPRLYYEVGMLTIASLRLATVIPCVGWQRDQNVVMNQLSTHYCLVCQCCCCTIKQDDSNATCYTTTVSARRALLLDTTLKCARKCARALSRVFPIASFVEKLTDVK